MNGTYDYGTGVFDGTYTITITYHRTKKSPGDVTEFDRTETIAGTVKGKAAKPGTPASGEKVTLNLAGQRAVSEHVVRQGGKTADEQWDGESVLQTVYVVK